MSRAEWVATLLNVASDLQAIAESIDAHNVGPLELAEAITDAKLAVEHITHEDPHL